MASGIVFESEFVFSDGGRCRYVGKGKPFKACRTNDCVIRAVCNATGMDYKEAYDALFAITRKHGYSPNQGVTKADTKKFIEKVVGWEWHPLMGIGTGCRVHTSASPNSPVGSPSSVAPGTSRARKTASSTTPTIAQGTAIAACTGTILPRRSDQGSEAGLNRLMPS